MCAHTEIMAYVTSIIVTVTMLQIPHELSLLACQFAANWNQLAM